MPKSILTTNQKLFLEVFPESKIIDKFYLTGGTALTEFYIPYRYSEDLDFFSEKEFEILQIVTYLKSIKNKLTYQKIDINTSFNRNIFQLIYKNDILKVEFTYFPFPQIEKPIVRKGIYVDSLIDIAVNKLFTIYQKPRTRDYIDLYMIYQKFELGMEELIKKAKAKFDWHVDPIKLGSQFLLVQKVKDYPKLIRKINHRNWQNFFLKEAKKLKGEIFE